MVCVLWREEKNMKTEVKLCSTCNYFSPISIVNQPYLDNFYFFLNHETNALN